MREPAGGQPAPARAAAAFRTPSCTCRAVPWPDGSVTMATRTGRASSGPHTGVGTLHGSRQLGPAITSNAAHRSATRCAIGPSTTVSWTPIGGFLGNREDVGREVAAFLAGQGASWHQRQHE
jgi:hypothetical protein